MNFILKLIISSLAVLISTYLLPGVSIDDNNILTAIIVATVLAFLNAVLKPLLVLFTIPITVFTLGFFLLIINAGIILITEKLVPGFHVDGFWWALLFSLILSFVTSILESLQKKDENTEQ